MALRRMRAVTTDGVMMVTPFSREEASLIGRHHNAVKAFINEGDEEALLPFRKVTVGGRRLPKPTPTNWRTSRATANSTTRTSTTSRPEPAGQSDTRSPERR